MIYASTMTKTGQVFFPKVVRNALGLEPGRRIVFDLRNNSVIIQRRESLDEIISKIDRLNSTQSDTSKRRIKEYKGLSASEALDKWSKSTEGKKSLKEQYVPNL